MNLKELKTDMINTARWAGLRIDENQAENLPPDFFIAIAALSGSYIFLRRSVKK